MRVRVRLRRNDFLPFVMCLLCSKLLAAVVVVMLVAKHVFWLLLLPTSRNVNNKSTANLCQCLGMALSLLTVSLLICKGWREREELKRTTIYAFSLCYLFCIKNILAGNQSCTLIWWHHLLCCCCCYWELGLRMSWVLIFWCVFCCVFCICAMQMLLHVF